MQVSVIIPTYNRADTILRAVDSVLRQTHSNLEIIIIDDGSTDQTQQVLQPYAQQVTIIRQANQGPSAARNRGIEVSRGEIIAFLDSDDVWLPEKLEQQVRLFDEGPAGMVCCVCNASLRHGKFELGTSFDRAGLDFGNGFAYWFNPAAVLATRFLLFNQVMAVRRSALLAVGGYKSGLNLLEDHDLAFRLALEGPWGVIVSTLVLKQEETEGIGVIANKDLSLRAATWRRVLEGFLTEDLALDRQTRKLVEKMLADVREEMRANLLAARGFGPAAAVGQMRLLVLRLRTAVWRRSPWWPKAKFTPHPLAG